MWLWVPRPSKDNSLSYLASRVFAPFSGGLWLTMVLFTFFMAIMQAYVFQDEWRDDGWDEWKAAHGPLQKLGVVLWQGGIRFARSGLDFMMGGIEECPATAPKMILMLGWAFFILIAVSAYTANLAAFLTKQSNSNDYIKSMEEAATARAHVCVSRQLYDQVTSLYPDNTIVAVDDLANELDKCDAFLESMNAALLGERDVHRLVCDVDHVAVALVLTVQNAVPATSDLAPVLTDVVQNMRLDEGVDIATFMTPYESESCPTYDEDDEATEDEQTTTGGRRRSRRRARRRLSATRRQRRRLKGSSGATTGGSTDTGDDSEDRGSDFVLSIGTVADTDPLTPSHFAGVLLVWMSGLVLATLLTSFDLWRTGNCCVKSAGDGASSTSPSKGDGRAAANDDGEEPTGDERLAGSGAEHLPDSSKLELLLRELASVKNLVKSQNAQGWLTAQQRETSSSAMQVSATMARVRAAHVGHDLAHVGHDANSIELRT